MLNFRKLTSLFLTTIMVFTTASPAIALVADNLGTYNAERPVFGDFDSAAPQPLPFEFDDVMSPASAAWTNLVAANAPAKLTTASYKLANEVIEIDSANIAAAQNVLQNIFSGSMAANGTLNTNLITTPNRIISEGGFVKKEILEEAVGRSVKNGQVVVDKATGTAFKVAGETAFTTPMFSANEELSEIARSLSDTYSVVQPQVHEVLEDFELGGKDGETVDLTLGNVTCFADGIENSGSVKIKLADGSSYSNFSSTSAPTAVTVSSVVPVASGGFQHVNKWIGFEFDTTPLEGYKADGSGGITLEVSGGVAIAKPQLTARYSAFKGYEFTLAFAQECYLEITLQASVNQEVYIPLFGMDIPFGFGSVKGGVFLVVGIDGNFRLAIMAGEYTSTKMGARGGTFCCIPTSVRPIFEHTTETSGDVNMSGKINAYVKVGPEMKISIFGLSLIGAGAYLGAGVSVEETDGGANLDVNLYGIFNVFITVIGKRCNLVNFTPTIIRKKQVNMDGYKLEVDDCYIAPGRVGGRFMKEITVNGKFCLAPPDKPVEYRIIVEKGGTGLAAGKKEYYPGTTSDSSSETQAADPDIWLETEAGEFFIGDGLGDFQGYNYGPFGNNPDGSINGIKDLGENDLIYIQFKLPDDSTVRTSAPISPSFPFKDVVITAADSFNDFVIGYIAQQQLKNWKTSWELPVEDRCELVYPPKETIVYITPMSKTTYDFYTNDELDSHYQWKGAYSFTAAAATDELGRFDTRISSAGPANFGWHITDHTPITHETEHTFFKFGDEPGRDMYGKHGDYVPCFDIVVHYRKSLDPVEYNYLPEMPSFYYNREIYPVEGTYTKTAEGNKIVDQMDYDEYIWIINPAGTRTISNEEFFYGITKIYSRVDSQYMDKASDSLWKNLSNNNYRLVRTTNADGSVTTMFSQRVTVEWVWQAHPNPVKINSAPISGADWLSTDGGTLQVYAQGLFPAYYLEGAPAGVTINKNTGLITVAPGMAPGDYPFTIVAVQEYRGTKVEYDAYQSSGWYKHFSVPDYEYYGHDPAPPDKRDYTLTIRMIPPVIQPAEQTSHGYKFTVDVNGGELVVPIYTIAGDQPITWSLVEQDRYTPLPDFVSIDPVSGVLRIAPNSGTPTGNYLFTISARNGGGPSSPITYASVWVSDIDNQLPVTEAEPAHIEFTEPRYTVQKGSALQVQYALTGDEPIKVTLEAAYDSDGKTVSGFSVDETSQTVRVPGSLAVGTYRVSARAENIAAISSSAFWLDVIAAPEEAQPPVIAFRNSRYDAQQGTAFQTTYTLTGTEPITVTVTAKNERGASVSAFSVNTSARTVNAAGQGLAAGTYAVTATAKNRAGESSATFTLVVTAARTAPVITEAKHEYAFEVTAGGQGLNVPVSATGSTPITWSLEDSDKMQLPIFVSIDSATGVLTTSARAVAGTYYFVIKATNDVGSDTRLCTLNVLEAGTAPAFAKERHDYTFSVSALRREPAEIQISVTGSAPITYSLEQYKEAIPKGVSIDPNTGVLTIGTGVQAGSYYFNIKATNNVGSAIQLCSLTVNQLQPQLLDPDNMEITPEIKPQYLIPLSSSMEAPSITLLSSTVGNPSAAVPLSPVAGQLQASEQLQTSEQLQATSNLENARSLLNMAKAHVAVIEWENLMNDPFSRSLADQLRDIRPLPINTATVRWDDKKDIYSNDRDTVNGTEYVFWDSAVKIDIRKSEYIETCRDRPGGSWSEANWNNGVVNFPEINTGAVLSDVYWYGDLYHAVGRNDVWGKTVEDTSPPKPEIYWNTDTLINIGSFFGRKSPFMSSTSGWDSMGVGEFYSAMTEESDRPIRSPRAGPEGYKIGVTSWQSLEYGSHIQEMADLKNGSYTVPLDSATGSYVPIDYFFALEDNKAMNLTFEQEGFNLTFAGKDMNGHESWETLYNFGYSSGTSVKQLILDATRMTEEEYLSDDFGALSDDGMLDLAGLKEGEHFTYSFVHHGDLPCMATFDITTTIPEGERVNVYKCDAGTGSFTLIAKNLQVGEGGVVTYRNNTMSDYIITTATIAGAAEKDGTAIRWLWIVVAAALVLAIAGVVVFITLRKKKRAGAPQLV
ncbi:MAG: putative Ig domain-containing protein [Clostridiales bacterium]|nr:putative Ig domain-containing protein [Clostridiales bacterium]